MATANPRVEGYASALFEIAKAEGELEQIEDELFRFSRTLENEIGLRDALTDLNLPPDHRATMVRELLGDRASPHTVNLVGFVIQQGRARDLPQIVDSLVERAARERNKAVAEVRTAVPLDAQQRERLENALRVATEKEITLKVVVDPSVLGGLVARVGDVVFDASVRRRLQSAKDHFARS